MLDCIYAIALIPFAISKKTMETYGITISFYDLCSSMNKEHENSEMSLILEQIFVL